MPSGIERSSRKNALFRQIDGVCDLPCMDSFTEEEGAIRSVSGVQEMVGDTCALDRQPVSMRHPLMRITTAQDLRKSRCMGGIIANAALTPKSVQRNLTVIRLDKIGAIVQLWALYRTSLRP